MSDKKLIINPKPAKGNDGYRTFSIRVKEKVVIKLEDMCKLTGYSRNELVNVLLEYAIENSEVGKKQVD